MQKILTLVLMIVMVVSPSLASKTLIVANNTHAFYTNGSSLVQVVKKKPPSNRLQTSLPIVQFDDNNVIMSFATISDTHIQGTNGIPSQKLASVLEQINDKANGELDALLISGDLTDYGLPEQVTELKRVIDNSKIDLKKTRFIFALGNHEYYNHQLKGAAWEGGYLFKDDFGDEVYKDATDQEIKAGDYHTVVKGYDFIAVNCTQYEGGVKYANSDIAWLKIQLAQAALNDPGKPIFVTSHPNITGTNLGSNEGSYWTGTDLYRIIKSYPQVIYFCGHLHFPENDERSIWQGDFTTIGVGSTYYCSNHPTDDNNGNTFIDIVSGFETADAQKTSQGLYIEIDKNNNVKITRMDFANKENIKSPWIIPSPKSDKSNLLYYTPKQEAVTQGNTAPVFPADAFVKEISKIDSGNGVYQLKFTQAIDNDMVYSYQISFINKATGKIIKTISTLSDFYLHANPNEMSHSLIKTINNADSLLAPFSLVFNKEYYIKVVAINCFGFKSKPLVSNLITNSFYHNKQLRKNIYQH